MKHRPCVTCDSHDVPLTSTESAGLDMHRAMHALGRSLLEAFEPVVDRIARWLS